MRKAVNYRGLHVLVVIFGLIITISAFTLVRNWDQQTAQVRYQSLANAALAAFSSQLQAYFSELDNLGQFFAYSAHVSQEEFHGFTQNHIKRFPAIEALMWVPMVSKKERAHFEAKGGQQGREQNVIHEHAADESGRGVPMGEREIYFPIAYVEPSEKDGYNIGFDLGSSHVLNALLQQALKNSMPKFSVGRVDVPGKGYEKHGFIVQKIETSGTYIGSRVSAGTVNTGFVVIRIDIPAAMKFAAEQVQAVDIEASIFDDSQAEEKRLVFSTIKKGDAEDENHESLPVYGLLEKFDLSRPLPLLGPQWRIEFTPTKSYLRQNFSWYPWITMLLGLAITVWLMALIGFWQRRTELMELAVDEGANALDKSRQRHKAILQTVAEGIITIDRHGLIGTFNRAAEDLFGYRADELIGKNVSILLPEKERLEHEGYTDNSQLHESRVINLARDLIGRRNDGSLFPLELNVAPFEGPEGKGFVGVLRDITERKSGEMALREQKERLSDILENTDDGYLQVDKKWRVTYINPRAEELLVISKKEVLGNDLREVMADVVSMFYKALRNTLIVRMPQQVVVFYGPSQKFIGANSTPTKDGLIVYFRDVSKQKHAEAELINAKEIAENANLAKSQYLSRMSHELRTPMNAVLGFGQLLEMDDTLKEEQHSNVEEIMNAGRHLLDLIDEVLDLSRVEAGKYDFKLSRINVSEIATESIALVSGMASKKDIRIEDKILDQCDKNLLLDAKATKQIFINLLSNAIKYNRDGGSVRLFCEKTTDEKRMRICVVDTGLGIDEENFQRLFDPFERLGREAEIEGTGVGLSVVKALVEGMGGTVGVESELGQGSTFWVEFTLINNL